MASSKLPLFFLRLCYSDCKMRTCDPVKEELFSWCNVEGVPLEISGGLSEFCVSRLIIWQGRSCTSSFSGRQRWRQISAGKLVQKSTQSKSCGAGRRETKGRRGQKCKRVKGSKNGRRGGRKQRPNFCARSPPMC